MTKTNRDPSVGSEWLAWFAITEGDEPAECVWDYLAEAKGRVLDLSARSHGRLTEQEEAFLSGLGVVLIALDAAANGGDTFNALTLSRRQGGRPNYAERRILFDEALAQFEALRADRWKVDAAAEEVQKRTGVSRSTLYAWRKRTARMRDFVRMSAKRPSS